jgi:hypothetical protein
MKLTVEVFAVSYSVGVVAVLPDFAWVLLANGEGVAALYELGGLFDRVGRRQENVDVIGHHDKAVEEIALLFAVTGEGCDQ